MIDFIGKFEKYSPQNADLPNALYLRSEAGDDWYDVVSNIAIEEGVSYVTVDDSGTVTSATSDPSRLFPQNFSVYRTDQPVEVGMARHEDGSFVVNMSWVRGRAISAVLNTADEMAEKLTGRVPAAERDSWPLKEQAARAYLAGEQSEQDTALLQAEAELTGETVAALAATIVQKSTLFRIAAGKIAGMRRTTIAAINEADTFEQVNTVLAGAKSSAELLLAELQ